MGGQMHAAAMLRTLGAQWCCSPETHFAAVCTSVCVTFWLHLQFAGAPWCIYLLLHFHFLRPPHASLSFVGVASFDLLAATYAWLECILERARVGLKVYAAKTFATPNSFCSPLTVQLSIYILYIYIWYSIVELRTLPLWPSLAPSLSFSVNCCRIRSWPTLCK